MKKFSFERKTLLKTDWFGLDSIQGILYFIDRYSDGSFLCFDQSTVSDVTGIYFYFQQLEKDGYVVLNLIPKGNNPNILILRSAALTINGRKLLDELTAKSKSGSVKKRLIDILWIVVVSMITTLIALWIKG